MPRFTLVASATDGQFAGKCVKNCCYKFILNSLSTEKPDCKHIVIQKWKKETSRFNTVRCRVWQKGQNVEISLVLRLGFGRLSFLGFGLFRIHVGCPESQVVTEQLHNERRVLVAFFAQSIKLGDRIIERLLREMASTVWRRQNFIVEHGKV